MLNINQLQLILLTTKWLTKETYDKMSLGAAVKYKALTTGVAGNTTSCNHT